MGKKTKNWLPCDNSGCITSKKKTFISNAARTKNGKSRRAIKSLASQELLHAMDGLELSKNALVFYRKKITWKIMVQAPFTEHVGNTLFRSLRSPFQPFLAPINSTCLYINACGYYVRASISIHEGCISRLKLTMYVNLSRPFHSVPHADFV